jgi:hypothetical protein
MSGPADGTIHHSEPVDDGNRKLKRAVATRLGRMVMGESGCLRAMARSPASARARMAGQGLHRSRRLAMDGSANLSLRVPAAP